jgi:hypothetical protein
MRNPMEEPDPPCDLCGLEPGSCTCPVCPTCGTQGDPKCYTDHGLTFAKRNDGVIRCRADLFAYLEADGEEQAKRHVYEYTDCGAWIGFEADGIRLGSIVEGTEIGTATYPLAYPFTTADYGLRIAAIEAEADALWTWANEGGEAGGLDPPDIASEYRHLAGDGRSC